MKLFEETKYTKYYADELGNFYSSTTFRGDGTVKKIKANKHKRGYLYIRTSTKNYRAHRVVASLFVPKVAGKEFVNHKDFDTYNNSASNLEWVTHKENINYSINAGRIKHIKNINAKYSNEQCKQVMDNVKSGMTYIKAGLPFGMPYSTVAHLIRGSRREI